MENYRPKAIALMSGGLDSTLAAKIILDQGIEVIGLHLVTPFGCRNTVQKNADAVGVPLLYKDKGEAYLDLVKNPRFGYGKNMNPCLDCRIFMFQLADVVRQEQGADFIVTGEVLGQRPMSQVRRSMELIDRNSPIEGLVVRPLSALQLPPSIPEKKGWVKREALHRIAGRGRLRQMELAKEYGISEYASPGGGCVLTEASFSGRLKDFFAHDEGLSGEGRLVQSRLLGVGRHFRFHEKLKVIVGRNEAENRAIAGMQAGSGGTLFEPRGFSGPVVLALGAMTEGERLEIGGLIARYGKGAAPYRIEENGPEASQFFEVSEAMQEERLGRLRIA